MKLNAVMNACGSRVSGGDPYQWDCYGENAQYMEFRNAQGEGYSHCIFDTKTYEVYEIHCEIPGKDSAFRWLNPSTSDSYYKEAKSRNVNPDFAWDEQKYSDIKTEEEILSMLEQFGNCNYSQQVVMKNKEQFHVNLDVRFVFDVEAGSMDEAVEKARHWQKTAKTSWGEGESVYWVDTEVVKETAARVLSY